MKKREYVVRKYFDCWLNADSMPLHDIFAPDVDYAECWGPRYHGLEQIVRWFVDWNGRNAVQRWDIKQFIHQGDMTAVEWSFQYRDDKGKVGAFDGVSLVRFSSDNRIVNLKEFGAKSPTFNPFGETCTS